LSSGGLQIVQCWFMPWYMYRAAAWQARWLIKYTIQKQEYTQEDKVYLTRTIMNVSDSYWESLEPKLQRKMLARELWKPENEKQWRDMQRRQTLAERAGDDLDLPE
jgi:hypothetical protein